MSENEMVEYEYKELADRWWKDVDFILPGREEEPTIFEIFHDQMISGIVGNPDAISVAAEFVTRTILIEVEHPKRGLEFVRIMINPMDISPGIPDQEPDLIIHMRYYDFVRTILGEIDMMSPIWAGNGWFLGNMTAALDMRDVMEVANGSPLPNRPAIWPRGVP